jgi:predicted transcriptional regulator
MVAGQGLDVMTVVDRRSDVLAALAEPKAKRDLVAELDRSRSTGDRAVRELAAEDLVVCEDGYRRTAAGRLAFELYEALLADLDSVAAASELLRPLPSAAPMSPAMLRGARIEVAEAPSPSTVVDPVYELFTRAEAVQAFSVAVARPDYADDIRDRLLAGEFEVECVYEEGVVEYARAEREGFAEFVADAPVEPYVHPDLPYALRLFDLPEGRTAAITVYDDEQLPKGVVINGSPEACEWAAAVFDRYRDAAAALELP